jgi:type II secretory pathway pseudopilin PulG
MKCTSPTQNQAGFTLLEVLVVAICVIILIGLVLALR